MIDLEFKNTPREKAYREFKAHSKPLWHAEQAEIAEQNENWFAATFHRAWVLKAEPETKDGPQLLQTAYEKLKAEYAEQDKELTPYLNPVVREMLALVESYMIRDFERLIDKSKGDLKIINQIAWGVVKNPISNEDFPIRLKKCNTWFEQAVKNNQTMV
ncbi:MAG: hypothetical protein COA78_14125 [Blastopirellula sp.]|nr:MAG: hypothetical protein COA78_14125 [Blastopirellula sp.]